MSFTAHQPSQELVNLVKALGGTWHGSVAMCRCPVHEDRNPSLSLRQGDTRILVTCFAGCDRGAILRALGPLAQGGSQPRSVESPAPRISSADRIWRQAIPVAGTPAARYLAARHLCESLPDLRFHPRCPLGRAPETVHRPCLLVAVREGTLLTAIQRIVLTADGSGYERKLMLGRPGQGAWQGARPAHILALAEGFEKAAAFARLYNIPTWSSLGARRLPLLSIPASVSTLVIAQDFDPEGLSAGKRAHQAYRREGLQVRRVHPSTPGEDWSDVLARLEEREGG